MTFYDSFDAELAELERRRVRRARQEWLVNTTSVDVADRLSRSFALYDADPSVHLAYAEAGIDPVADAEVWASTNAASQVVARSAATGVTGRADRLTNPSVLAQFDEGGTLIGFDGVGAKESSAMVEAIGQLTAGDPREPDYVSPDQYVQAIEAGAVAPKAFVDLLAQTAAPAIGKVSGGSALEDFQQVASAIPVTGRLIAGAAGTTPVREAANFVRDNPVTDFVQTEILGPVGRFARDNPVTTEAIQPTIRAGVTLLDFPYQATQAAFRTQYGRYRENGVGAFLPDDLTPGGLADFATETGASHLESVLQTQVGVTAFDLGEEFSAGGESLGPIDVGGRIVNRTTVGRENRVIGEGVNTGGGFFFADQAEGFRQGMERSQGLLNGQTVTIGRWAASPLDAGSRPHTILSGLIDASLAIAGPGELAIDSTFDAFRAQRAFRTTEGGLPGVTMGNALIDASDPDEVVALLRTAGVRTFSDEDVARVVRARTTQTVQDALARMDTPGAPALLDDASSLAAPPRRPSAVDLNAEVPAGAREALQARWGALRGVRATVDPNAVRHFLDSRRGTRLTENIAELTDSRQIDRILNRALPAERLGEYVDAASAADVRRLLDEDLGVTIASRPGRGRLPHVADAVRDFAPRASRLAGSVPSGFYDLDDSRRLLDTVEDVLVNTGANSRTLDYWHGRFTGAITRRERFAVLTEMTEEMGLRAALDGADDIMPQVRRWADDAGMDVEDFWTELRQGNRTPTGIEEIDAEIRTLRNGTQRLATLFRDHLDRGRVYDLDYMTGNLIDTMVRVGDETTVIDRAAVHLQSEAINRLVPVPDSREMRRFFSNLRPILLNEQGGLRVSAKVYNAALGVQSDIWKPTVLLRLAWPVRVIGEEQVRLAAGGYSSLISHPVHHMSVMMGNRKFLSRQLQRLGYDIGDPTRRLVGDFAGDLFGERLALADEHLQAMSSGSGRSFSAARSPSFEIIATGEVDEARALEAWAEEMSKLSHDQVGGMILRSESLDEAKEVFWENMETVRSDIRVGRPDTDIDVMTRAGADAYIDSVSDRMHRLTNSNPELLEAMRSRGIGEVPMGGGKGQLNGNFVRALKGHKDSIPPYLPAREILSQGVTGSGRFDGLDQATEWMFSQLMAKPTDQLSRSPVFRQEYWNEVQALAPRMRRADAAAVIVEARRANLPAADIQQLRRNIGRDVGGVPRDAVGSLTRQHVDTLAKGAALDRTQDLLFDLSQRNQLFDAMSLIFPFGDAWAEVVTRWATLIAEDPQVVRRASQAIEGGRETGFIYENENGEEVFNYPLSGWATEAIAGVRIPLTGRVQGLSLATEILPGVGPVAQLPLAAAVPNTPEWDRVREILFPFGEPEIGDNPINLVSDQFIPPAWRKIFTGLSEEGATPDEARSFASSFGNVFSALGSTGEYDVFNSDPVQARDEWQRLMDDAQDSTGLYWMARGLFQLAAPSAPAPEWYIDDPDGTKVQIATLRELYGRAFEESPEDPIGYFLEEYGPWALAAVQGRTVAVAPGRGLPPTKEAEEWARNNPDLADDFSLVYGFFAPQGGEFDYQAYSRILDRGERTPLSEQEQVTRFLHTLGSFDYTREKERVEEWLLSNGWDGEGLMPIDARRYLAEYDEGLVDKYGLDDGGYGGRQNTWSGPGRASVEEALGQLRDAVQDERLADDPVAGAARELLTRMDEADERFAIEHTENSDAASWHESTDGAPYRQFIVQSADWLIRQTPEFAQLYDAVFEPQFRQGLERDEQGD